MFFSYKEQVFIFLIFGSNTSSKTNKKNYALEEGF